MYNGIHKIEEVIEYIEENITEELDCKVLASRMNLFVYEFRRIFSFIVGCPISEYIRKRRLSLAACEIMTSEKVDMLDICEKYGYTSQSAFIKAFGEQHGVSPTACLKEERAINLFTRPKFQLSVSGRESVPFKIIRSEEFYIQGFRAISQITDSCCCENVWSTFYEKEIDQALMEKGMDEKLFVAYQNKDSNVACTIGAEIKEHVDDELDFVKIPASRFACFKMNTVDDDIVNEKYSQILYELLPSANLKRREDVPTVEVYPFDMSEDGFEWEIRIPVGE